MENNDETKEEIKYSDSDSKKINNNEEESDPGNEIFEWVKSIAIAIAIALFIKSFVLNTTLVIGDSMYPTLEERDRLVSVKVPLYYRIPKKGDIVVLEAPDDEEKDYIKRVIGLPGDTVEIMHGSVFVNHEELDEDYIEEDSFTHTYTEEAWIVGEDEVFVLGDNREENASKDSRIFGCIKIDSIKGIANFRYYPFKDKFGKLE